MQINVRMTLAEDGREWSRTYDVQFKVEDGISQPELLSEVRDALSTQLKGLRPDAKMVTEKPSGAPKGMLYGLDPDEVLLEGIPGGIRATHTPTGVTACSTKQHSLWGNQRRACLDLAQAIIAHGGLPTPDELPIGQLEDRYYILKRNHMSEDNGRTLLEIFKQLRIQPIQNAAVVESDWPCYDKVVSLILTEDLHQKAETKARIQPATDQELHELDSIVSDRAALSYTLVEKVLARLAESENELQGLQDRD